VPFWRQWFVIENCLLGLIVLALCYTQMMRASRRLCEHATLLRGTGLKQSEAGQSWVLLNDDEFGDRTCAAAFGSLRPERRPLLSNFAKKVVCTVLVASNESGKPPEFA